MTWLERPAPPQVVVNRGDPVLLQFLVQPPVACRPPLAPSVDQGRPVVVLPELVVETVKRRGELEALPAHQLPLVLLVVDVPGDPGVAGEPPREDRGVGAERDGREHGRALPHLDPVPQADELLQAAPLHFVRRVVGEVIVEPVLAKAVDEDEEDVASHGDSP